MTKITARKAPIKAILLDQGLLAGVGNWIADEVSGEVVLCVSRRPRVSLCTQDFESAVTIVVKISVKSVVNAEPSDVSALCR